MPTKIVNDKKTIKWCAKQLERHLDLTIKNLEWISKDNKKGTATNCFFHEGAAYAFEKIIKKLNRIK